MQTSIASGQDKSPPKNFCNGSRLNTVTPNQGIYFPPEQLIGAHLCPMSPVVLHWRMPLLAGNVTFFPEAPGSYIYRKCADFHTLSKIHTYIHSYIH